MVEESTSKPRFLAPAIQENPNGWGPVGIPDKFKNLPFQSFNKGDRIGKIANWTENGGGDRRYNRYQQQYHTGTVGLQYAYQHDQDDINFTLVDTSKPQRTAMQRATKIKQMQHQRRLYQKAKEQRQQAGYVTNQPGKANKSMVKERQKQLKQWQRRGGYQRQRYDNRGHQKTRQPSVQVKPEWEVLEEMDFPRLSKLNFPNVDDGVDIPGHRYGTMEFYDKAYDRVTTRSERPLQRINRVSFVTSTTDDPVIRQLAKQGVGTVFGTDVILSALMACTRSVYSWDIVVNRVGSMLFFDKRARSDLDYLTVSETAVDPPSEDTTGLNSTTELALEATFINQNFSQQVLKKGDDGEVYKFDHPKLPFAMENDAGEVRSVGYRYRKWNLGSDKNGKDIVLVSRTEHDGVMIGPNGEPQFITIKAFNEWDSKLSGGVDWRSKLDSQKGAVLATELKNNSCKLARWTVQSMLAGSDHLKFGYVSRVHARDSTKHVILSTQQYKPQEFATNITLNMDNAWGILRCMIDFCLSQPTGKYLIMKDPNKPMVRLYKLPAGALDEENEDESSDEEDD